MNKKKGSRDSRKSENFRKNCMKKKLRPANRYEAERAELDASPLDSTSAKKLKTAQDIPVPEESSIGYRILNFFTVFSALSECVKCKTCGGDVKFAAESIRGLGFKILVSCPSCKPTSIPSCPYIKTYEINQRFHFAMRYWGLV